MTETNKIRHSIYGEYEQIVYDTVEDAGHKKLASEGRYGWGMPTDPATERFVSESRGKVVLEIGCGLGDVIALPALLRGVKEFWATDISKEHLDENSYLVKKARELGVDGALRTTLLSENWWNSPLQENPTVQAILSSNLGAMPPENGTVDLIMARHSLQFGTPETFLNFLDLADAALKVGGKAVGINFTQFTNYLFRYDEGRSMKAISGYNKMFRSGEIDLPGGFLHPTRGLLDLTLAKLMGKPELDRKDANSFLYLDQDTVEGLIRLWNKTRVMRGLPQSLEIVSLESCYFSPPSIARVNRLNLPDSPVSSHFNEHENYVFTLRKVQSKELVAL